MTNSCNNLDKFRDRCSGVPGNSCDTCRDTLFRKVVISTIMGSDEPGQPYAPKNGAYTNALVYYEATGISYLYSSDGLYTEIANVDITGAVNSVNGKTGDVTLTASDVGAATRQDIGNIQSNLERIDNSIGDLYENKQNTLIAGSNITIENNVISASGGGSIEIEMWYEEEIESWR